MELKDVLKSIKMNESKISAILGILVIAVIGLMVFNYFKNITPGTTTPVAITQENQGEETKKHIVKSGESLSSIAREVYGNPNKWTLIRDANEITDSNNLTIGQELIIPASDAPTVAEATIKPIPTPNASIDEVDNTNTTTTYTVERGDNLWEIAEKTYGDGYQWTKIAKANNLKNPNIIHSGNVFSIPR